MISVKPTAAVAMLTLAGALVAQKLPDERRNAELIEQLKSGDTWQESAAELLRIGAPVAQFLARALLEDLDKPAEEQEWKSRALDVLTFMGPDAAIAADTLYEALGRLPLRFTAGAFHAWAEAAPYAGIWVRVLLWRPGKDNAVIGLSRNGQREDIIVSVGAGEDSAAMNDVFAEVQRISRRCLQSSWQAGSLEKLVEQLEEQGNPFKHEIAIELLAARGAEAREALPLIAELLIDGLQSPTRSRDARSRDMQLLKMARAIVRIAPDDVRSLRAYRLLMIEHELDAIARRDAAMRIGSFGAVAKEAVPDLLVATDDKSSLVAREAITALGMIGPAATDAIPTLEELTEHPDPQIAARAKAALRQIRGSAVQRLLVIAAWPSVRPK